MIRKFIISMSVILLLVLTVLTSGVEAYPYIEVEGFVDLSNAVVTDNLDGTTTFSEITYTFNVLTADFGAEMWLLGLRFESDIFSSIGSISVIDPIGWVTTGLTFNSNTYELAWTNPFTGTTLGAGESLSFTIADVVLFDDALADAGLWDEGQVWAQSWGALATLGGFDIGSTATVTPEPGTLLLLGSGLIGLGYFIRRRKRVQRNN